MFNNVLDRKETFFGRKKFNISKSQKYRISKRVNQFFWSEMYNIFPYLFSFKIRLEIMFNKVPNKKETFFGHTKFNLSKSQKLHFFKGANPCFWSKNVNFFFVFGQNMTRNNV